MAYITGITASPLQKIGSTAVSFGGRAQQVKNDSEVQSFHYAGLRDDSYNETPTNETIYLDGNFQGARETPITELYSQRLDNLGPDTFTGPTG